MNSDSKINVNIIGSCVSRDVFNREEMGDYRVKTYIQRMNPYLAFQKTLLETPVNDSDIDEFIKSNYCHIESKSALSYNFNRIMLKYALNSDFINTMDCKNSWIIIDTFYAYSTRVLHIHGDKGEYLLSSDIYMDLADNYLDFSNNGLTKIITRLTINYNIFSSNLIEYLKKYNGKVILINSLPTINSYSRENYKAIFDNNLEEIQLQCAKFCEPILKNVKCQYIEIPSGLPTRDGHIVHYTKSVGAYLARRIKDIVKRGGGGR